MKKVNAILAIALLPLVFLACQPKKEKADPIKEKLSMYKSVSLTTDLSWLSANEKEAIKLLIQAADIMDAIYWEQAYGDKDAFLNGIKDENAKAFAMINYGPWDRLDGNMPFIDSIQKPEGANYYPLDMTKQEFEAWQDSTKTSLYTLIRRDEKGALQSIPYSQAYAEQHKKASDLILQAAELVPDEGFKNYLKLRAQALLDDNYQPSDYAWMDMKTSNIDFVIGPIENYEDALFGYKAAHEAFVLVKDPEWSAKLEKYTAMLPALQAGLPVDQAYKNEVPGTDSDMNVYDAIYYAGDCNSGSKTIAINLPNDEEVQLAKGSRKLQLKNSMKAKFDNILAPIANILIDESQRKHIKFDAFFENTTFHEVAHGMGIKNTITGKGTIRETLKDTYSSIEEAKADILGLYLVTKLYEMGEITSGEVMDNYVTFLAGIFRSCRFGAASSHGKANMMRFYYFEREGAFVRQENGTYKVDFDKMKNAVISSVQQILIIQGDGNYDEAVKLIATDGVIKEQLKADLDRINQSGIPVDIVFEQGVKVLGL
ncbi:MAG: Zn-dependent hydrolase [Bacteroidales bacterium]|nr:Zn-dependent hydrolase [Bacteroidales bacterium]